MTTTTTTAHPASPGHTPGPWVARLINNFGVQTWVIDGPRGSLAIAQDIINPDDARLMAKAPAMLAALRSVAGVMDMADPESENANDSSGDIVDALLADCADVVRILHDLDNPRPGA